MVAVRVDDISLRPSHLETSRLAWAFAISIALHLALWGGYSVNKRYHLVERLHLPAWMQKLAQAILPARKAEELQPTVNPEPPLMFVDVSPAQATTEVPKNTPFYSDKNSKAANPTADKDSGVPKISGAQDQVIKTADVPKKNFDKLQPSRPAPKGEVAEQTQAKAALIPGDLTLAKPNPQPNPDKGTAEKTRPLTLQEAKARSPQLPGQKMRQEGGVRQQQLEAAFDTKSTITGAYDAAFIAAVQKRWNDLLEQTAPDSYRQGKVMLQFTLNYDGRITDLRVLESTVNETLSLLCQKSILDPAPFGNWTRDMRLMIGKDYREIKFTFYYN